jgi:hypothetical protein
MQIKFGIHKRKLVQYEEGTLIKTEKMKWKLTR